MKNKVLISILCCFAFVVLIVVLSSTVFTLKEVRVEFYDTNDQLITDYNTLKHFTAADTQSIIDSANFNMGQNIFLVKKEQYTNSLEKNNPYLKVITLTTYFPNKIIIKVHEREELFAVPYGSSGLYAITDGEMKVLYTTDTPDPFGAVVVSGLDIDAAGVIVGQKLTGGNVDVAAQLNYGLQKSLDIVLALKNQVILQVFKSAVFEVDTLNSEHIMLRMMTRDHIPLYDTNGNPILDSITGLPKSITIAGMKIEIHNAAYRLDYKIQSAFQIFEYIVNQEYGQIEVEGSGTIEEYKGTIKIFDDAGSPNGLKKVYVPAL
ncbi:MAG: FtsQ-type POTRA domain-containing protein [Christensenellaceae bacterium]|jgi:hypothetical protein|nr:FtsQ-type POTRA domain-containing protein [Christensenellaceae bacterium]